jgi:uncharacterized protein (TIGR03437 family)
MTRLVCLIAGVCFYVSAAFAQIGSVTNVGTTTNNMDAIAFNSSGTLYGGTSGVGSLYTINPASGAVTLVHALVGASNAALTYGVLGLAFQPGTGTLYGATSQDSPNSGNSLVTINPATGQVTVIGPSGDGRPYTDIGFTPDGKLYGWLIDSGGKTASVAIINLETGAGTSLGNSQANPGTQWAGLAVNSSGVIYVAANGHAHAPCGPQDCNGALWTINPANGAPTTVATLSGGPGVAPTFTALAFAPSGILYAIEGGFGGTKWNLVTMNLTAGGANVPTISSLTNAASNISPGLPNAGIAPGAIFVVYGTNLGPAKISYAPSAFQSTTLSGTSIEVTVGDTKSEALMLYTSANQIAALLPSDTPVGPGGVTVTYNGSTSGPAAVSVVPNNVGLFSIDASGSGPGVVMYPDYSLVSAVKSATCGGTNTDCGAANPGDALILWATGLGPIKGSDAAGAGLGENMPNIPVKVWVGGVQAKVNYQGRSGCCIGEDQIVFTVPDNAPTGCAIPLLVQIGSAVSNNILVPVAKGTRTCPLLRSDLSPLGTEKIEQLITAGPVNTSTIKLARYSDGNGHFEDDAKFQFFKLTSYVPGSQPFFVSWLDDPPAGTCLVYNNPNQNLSVPVTGGSALDAGPNVTVMGPTGNMTLPVGNQKISAFDMTGAFLVPGDYTITGTGGADVGPFSGTITIPEQVTLVSPENNSTVTRANGLKVTWTGGSGNLQIDVNSCVDSACNTGASASCKVPASLHSFTIPPYVLQALPAGNFAGFVLSSYSESSFPATGLDSGAITTLSNQSGFGYGWGSGGFTLK